MMYSETSTPHPVKGEDSSLHLSPPARIPGIHLDTSFDVSFANDIARLESYNKHHYRPNSYLHKWWARRCGSTFRLILKGLVSDEVSRDYYAPGGLEGKVILDPMMGGGTTLHEAIRLGANVIGADLDPIPVLQARATLSDIPLVELEQAFFHFDERLRMELDPFWQTACPHCLETVPLRFVLSGLRRYCACGPVLVVDSLLLRQEADGRLIRLCPRCHAVVQGGNTCLCSHDGDDGRPPTARLPVVEKRTKQCSTCNQTYQDDLTQPYYARYEPLVVVGRCRRHNLFFKSPQKEDREAIQRADAQRAGLQLNPSAFIVEPGRKSIHLIRRGITNYLELFSSRQLLYLERAILLLPQFASLIRLNLGLLVSTSLEFNSLLCGYKGSSRRRAGAIRHTFSHHAYSFPYTALENNPLYPRRASGTLRQLFHARIRRGRLWAQQPLERDVNGRGFVPIEGEVDVGAEVQAAAELAQGTRRFRLIQGSSTMLDLADKSVDYIVTDPPYFDSVQYSDLAAFFRVWLRYLLPDEAVWHYDVAESAVDPHKNDKESRYTEIISAIFRECYRVLRKENGRLIFTFHHWNPKGWAALTIALQQAGFILLNYAVVHAENPISVHIANMKALIHDAILVLAPLDFSQAAVEQSPGIPGWRKGPAWKRPLQIDQRNSEAFCRDCATLLGWLLTTNLSPAEIETCWQQALDGSPIHPTDQT